MQIELLKELRGTFPTPLGDKHGEFLLKAASVVGWGLLRKPSGTNVALPDGTRVASDILMEPSGHIVDFLVDGTGAAEVVWQDKGEVVESSRFYAAQAPAAPPETPAVPSPDLAARVGALEDILKQLIPTVEDHFEQLYEGLRSAQADIAVLEKPRSIRTEKGGGLFSHSHEVKL
jgi:hypothetical protein